MDAAASAVTLDAVASAMTLDFPNNAVTLAILGHASVWAPIETPISNQNTVRGHNTEYWNIGYWIPCG